MNLRIKEIQEAIGGLEAEKLVIQSACNHTFKRRVSEPDKPQNIYVSDARPDRFTYEETCEECMAKVKLSMIEVCPNCHNASISIRRTSPEDWEKWCEAHPGYNNFTDYECNNCGQVIRYTYYDR